MTWILVFIAGILLSAYFSGSETGFYRATRVRLVLDGLSGDRVARLLLWLTNHPALFVATTLVGNNFANYLVSIATVNAGREWFGGRLWVELATPVIVAPVVFIYGELLPKNLFLAAPNTLMRRTGPIFLAFTAIFLPISIVLWALSQALTRLVGEPVPRMQLLLARRELARVFDEGHLAGVLRPTQWRLAQHLIENAQNPVIELVTPLHRAPKVRHDADSNAAVAAAKKFRQSDLIVLGDDGRSVVGYLQTADALLAGDAIAAKVRPILEVSDSDPNISVLTRLYNRRERLALVRDAQGRNAGIVSSKTLSESLLTS